MSADGHSFPRQLRSSSAAGRDRDRLQPGRSCLGAAGSRSDSVLFAWAVGARQPLAIYSAPIGVLHRLTDHRLSLGEVEAEEYVNLLQALLSFEGVEIWDRCLDGLQSGEYEVGCPYCGVTVFIVIGQEESFGCSDDYALGEVEKVPLQPMRTQLLDGLPRRLFTRAMADGQESVAQGIAYLFGRAVCPDCGTDFSVAERVVAGWIP